MTPSTQSPGEGELIARLRAVSEQAVDGMCSIALHELQERGLTNLPVILQEMAKATESAADTIERLSERLARMEEERRLDREALEAIANADSPFDGSSLPLQVRIAKDLTRRIEIARARLSRQPSAEQP